jgi:hypothetical protein
VYSLSASNFQLKRSRQVEFDLFEAAINVLTLKQAGTSILELFHEVKNSPRFRGLPWRAVAWRGVAWRGVAWRGRVVAWPCCAILKGVNFEC